MSERGGTWKWLKWVILLAVLAGGAGILWHFRQEPVTPEVWQKHAPHVFSPRQRTQMRADEALPQYLAAVCQGTNQQGMSKKYRDELEQLLTEIFTGPEFAGQMVYAGQGRMDDLSISVQAYVFAHRMQVVNSSAHWLAYCVAESATRPATAEEDKLPEDYANEIESLRSMMREEILKNLSPTHRESMAQMVDAAAERFKLNVEESIRRYRSDILCPAFREPYGDKRQQVLQGMNWRSIAIYPNVTMRSSTYRQYNWASLRNVADTSAQTFLRTVFMQEAQAKIAKTRYWGGMGHSGGAGYLEAGGYSGFGGTYYGPYGNSSGRYAQFNDMLTWPMLLEIHPNETSRPRKAPTTKTGLK